MTPCVLSSRATNGEISRNFQTELEEVKRRDQSIKYSEGQCLYHVLEGYVAYMVNCIYFEANAMVLLQHFVAYT